MCFAPQRHALFRHLNFQKWSGPGVFCTFCLRNVLRATTACTFSTSQLFKVLRSWGVLYILTSKCASRHNGVQFFISHLARWLRTRRFSEPTFRPCGATNHWKNILPFRASASSFFWLFLFSDLLSSTRLFFLTLSISAFHLSILSTSKLPSMMYCYLMSCLMMYFCVVYWYVMYSWVLYCSVISSYAVYSCVIYCYVMWCRVL